MSKQSLEQLEAVSNFLEALGYNVKTLSLMDGVRIKANLLKTIDELPKKIKHELNKPDATKIIGKF